jgi:hypothetical protein
MKQIRKLNFQAMLQPWLSNNGCYNVFAIIYTASWQDCKSNRV